MQQHSQVDGRKFRRQHSEGPFVLDSYCPECRLAIELDGEGHFSSMGSEGDYRRDQYLKRLNIRVLRVENKLVFQNIEAVSNAIRETVAEGGGEGKTKGNIRPTRPSADGHPSLGKEGS